jgi:hypothetical protein
VDRDGTVTVAEGAQLDYEETDRIIIIARLRVSVFLKSLKNMVYIRVFDIRIKHKIGALK